MKRSIRTLASVITLVLVTCFLTISTTTNVFAAQSKTISYVDPDGTVHGVQIGTDKDGKPIYSQPSLSPEMQKISDAKSAMAEAHALYKNNKITKDAYISKLKALGADDNTIAKANNTTPYSAATTTITKNNVLAAQSKTISYVDPDGTVHGVQIGTDKDGKPIYSQPSFSPEMQKISDAKSAMAEAHALYKNNKITKDAYISKLKALGADDETIAKANNTNPY